MFIDTTKAVIALLTLFLAGCVSNNTPTPPCCYSGAVTVARLADLKLRTEGGEQKAFTQVFTSFTPQQGLFASTLRYEEALSEDIIYASLRPLIDIYDANLDGRLEIPEMVVLYVSEAARATGTPLRHVGGDAPIRAVAAANADLGGLLSWVRTRRDSMNKEGQTIFRDLQRLDLDLASRGSEGDDPVIKR